MSIQEVKPNRFVVQVYRADPLGEERLRLCKRVEGRKPAEQQERAFNAQASEWAARRSLIRQARSKGIAVALPFQASNATSFADYLTETYLPWAKTHLDPRTIATRSSTLMILAEDLGNTPLVDVEGRVNGLVEKWRAEGCRFSSGVDRLGRQMNRKPRSISDPGLNERLKILRSILGHAHMESRILDVRPRIPLIRKKRAAADAGKPIRYFTHEESVRFLRYSIAGTDDVFQVGKLLGLRPDELFHATVGWVDFRQTKVFVQTGPCAHCAGGVWLPKTGRFRGVDICDDLLPILRRLTNGKPDDEVLIPSAHGLPYWRRVGSGGRFTRTLKRAGLDRKGLSIYSLRHSFAADLVSAGRSLQEVAALLGNSVRVCEMHDGHLRPDVTRETVTVLRAVQPWGPPPDDTKKPKRRRPTLAAATSTATESDAGFSVAEGGDANAA